MEIFWSSESDSSSWHCAACIRGWIAVASCPGSAMQDADSIMGGRQTGVPASMTGMQHGDTVAYTPEFAPPMNTGNQYDALMTSGETISIIRASRTMMNLC